jgi:hypothetical protein
MKRISILLFMLLAGVVSSQSSAQANGSSIPAMNGRESPNRGAALTNPDIIRMVQAKLGDDLIMAKSMLQNLASIRVSMSF